MPTINKTVDKTIVNGSETFIYTFNVSFSGLVVPSSIGKVIDFFPSKIKYQLPPIGGQLVSINQIPVTGGTNVEFNFGTVNAGTALSFTMACQFGPGRIQGDTFTNSADLYADSLIVATASAPLVNLVLDNNFRLIKVAKITAPVKANEEVTFNLILQNDNDPGYRINNIVLTDILPSELIPVTTFTPIGNDTSNGGYNDNAYNGKTGSFTGNTLNFTLPSFNGSSYTIVFKAKVISSVIPGQTISNTATWTVDGIPKIPSTATFKVFEDLAKAFMLKRGPLYASLNDAIQYSITTTNTGTVTLNNVDIIDTTPSEVNITKLSFYAPVIITNNYSLFIATSEDINNYKVVATNLTGTSVLYDLSPLIPSGQRVVKVKATLSNLNTINTAAVMYLYGSINNSAILNQVITNTSNMTATSALGNVVATDTANTTLNGKSILKISKYSTPTLPAYYPLNEFRFLLLAEAQKGMVFDPTISDLLPLGIDYVPGNDYFIYYSVMEFKSYDSRNPGFPVPLPTTEIIKNYQNSGRTLVRYKFSNFNLQFMNNISANFTVIVKLNPPTSFTNYGYLGNPGKNTEVDGTSYLDSNDLDGDGIVDENIAQSNAITGNILTTSEFSIEKWVKGDLDIDYSKNAFTTPGGDVTYKLNITNNQTSNLNNIQLVDILPYPGDTGVILNTTPRGSQFSIYATSVVTAEIINILGEPVDPNPRITIEYSTSSDPVRFNEQGTGTIGTGTWSLVPPIDITTIRSIKVTTDPSVILKPYERLIVTIFAKAPAGVSINLKAYNSYAVLADKITGGISTPMNPTEPNKVSVQINLSNLASIGNLVWIDTNNNGLYDVGEVGLNGVTVELYDASMTLLKTTITTNNNLNQPGYYSFNQLNAGNYYVKFIPFGNYILTTQQLVVNGSKPNPTTKLTNLITLTDNEINNTIIAGVIEPTKASIGNLIWIDTNNNGLYDVGEVGLNGVTVELYDASMTLLKTTITTNNNLNQPGYYSFNQLNAGNYYVKFIPFGNYILTTQQLVVNGSKPNPTTKLTNLITLTDNEINNTIIAGVFICTPPVIIANNKCEYLNQPFNPMTGVTARDCQGNNITGSIVITYNNVDTSKVGIYSVTYEVTDSNNQTTIKTITVKVCKNGPRLQAIVDIYESVALEQTALSHILNAEGEKLQKALSLNLSQQEILKFNHSVTKTINSITNLETVLLSKMELFNSYKNKDCCDN